MNLTAEQLSAIIAQALVAANATASVISAAKTVTPISAHTPPRTIQLTDKSITSAPSEKRHFYFEGFDGISMRSSYDGKIINVYAYDGKGYKIYGLYPEVSIDEMKRLSAWISKTMHHRKHKELADKTSNEPKKRQYRHLNQGSTGTHFKLIGYVDFSREQLPPAIGTYEHSLNSRLRARRLGNGAIWVYVSPKGQFTIGDYFKMSYVEALAMVEQLMHEPADNIKQAIAKLSSKGQSDFGASN